MQAQSDLTSFLWDCVQQLESRLKEFKLKAEANKKKKGASRNDSSRRSAEQVEDHKKYVSRLHKVSQKDTTFENDHVFLLYQDRNMQRTER